MNKFQEFYNQQRGWKGSNKEQNRTSLLKTFRKERRTRMFDLFRGHLGTEYKSEELQPIPKITYRDTISKFLRNNKKKPVKKAVKPFVVGTVKHKIHSPPFLHSSLKNKTPKKKLIHPLRVKSFAPVNYKFHPPKGLTINILTPMREEQTITSPFCLNTVWNKVDTKTTCQKNVMHGNVTVRPRDRRVARLNSSSNSVFGTGTITEEIGNSEHINAKKELWPADEDDEPVFGRLNLNKKRLTRETLSKGNEKEDELQKSINQSVHPSSSSDCGEEEFQNSTIENLSGTPNSTTKTPVTVEKLNADIFKTPVQSDFKQSIPAKKTTLMDYRVSQISPPKSILSSTIFNFDVSRIHTGLDSTISEEGRIPCSTPVVKVDSEVTPKQVENAIVAPIALHKFVENSLSPPNSLPISSVLSKVTIDNKSSSIDKQESLLKKTSISPIQEPAMCQDNLKIDDDSPLISPTIESCNKVLTEKKTVEEFLLDDQNTESENIVSSIRPIQEPAMNQVDTRIDDDSPLTSPTVETCKKVQTEKNTVKEFLLEHRDTETESIFLAISPIQKPTINQVVTRIDDNSPLISPTIESCNKVLTEKNTVEEFLPDDQNIETESIVSANSSIQEPAMNQDDLRVDDNSPLVSPTDKDISSVEAEETRQKVLNSTYTKYSVIIEEDEVETGNVSRADCGLIYSENAIDLQVTLKEQLTSLSTNILNQTNLNEDDNLNSSSLSSSPEVTVKLAPRTDVRYDNSEKLCGNQSQEQQKGAITDFSDFTVSKSSTITQTLPTEVDFQKSEASNSTAISKVSCNKSKCNKLCCYTGVNAPLQMEEKNDMIAEGHCSLDATEGAKTISNQILTEIQTPEKVSFTPETGFTIKVSSPIGVQQTLLRVASNQEDAPAGTVQPRSSSRHVPVINLTDSPIEPKKELAKKSGLRRSTMDCKSPILQSLQKRYPALSKFDESIVVDLISDDEEDYTTFVDRVLKKYGATSKSPQHSPRIRTPLASIGNIPRLSACRTPQSPLVNSPPKKALISPAKFIPGMSSSRTSSQTLSAKKDVLPVADSPAKTPVPPAPAFPVLHVSPPHEPARTVKDVTPIKVILESSVEKALHDTPRKTSRRRNAVKEIAIEVGEVPSPMRVMSLRTRNISVSPSPKKVTPRKTPSRRKPAKELAIEISNKADTLQDMKLRENDNNEYSSPKDIIPQVETACKTPLRRNLAKEVAEEASEDTGHLRVMSLRSRNVSVSPSPKKLAPRRRKKDNQLS